ncbi:MAG: hypothetical protein P1U65_07735 [Minwuia sp.]|nr:hypothetical protein [Minwuia sp.]
MTEWHTDPPGLRGVSQRRMAWTERHGLCFVIHPFWRGPDWIITLGSKGPGLVINDESACLGILPERYRHLPDPPEPGIRSLLDSWKPIATAPAWPQPFDLMGWCDTFGLYPMTRLRHGTFAMLSSSHGEIIRDGDNPDAPMPITPTHWQRLDNFIPVTR